MILGRICGRLQIVLYRTKEVEGNQHHRNADGDDTLQKTEVSHENKRAADRVYSKAENGPDRIGGRRGFSQHEGHVCAAEDRRKLFLLYNEHVLSAFTAVSEKSQSKYIFL